MRVNVISSRTDRSMGDRREAYARRFPIWSQQLITIFSGKAAPGQFAPRWMLRPMLAWVFALIQLPIAIGGGIAAVSAMGWYSAAVLPLFWLLTVNALRKLQVTFSHHAVHREISTRPAVNRMIQVISSTLTLTHNYEDYFADHVRSHHSRKVFTTAADPDAAFLMQLGFLPGSSVKSLKWRLIRTPISLRFHLMFVLARIRTNLVTSTWSRKSLAVIWIAALVGLGFVVSPAAYILGLLVPLLPLYHISALLQFLSEHQWLASVAPPASREEYASRCWGRFCLEPLPAAEGGSRLAAIRAWSVWFMRTLTIQVPARFGVLVSDLPVHDLHHVVPADHLWTQAFWRRQGYIDDGNGGGMGDREFSLGGAIYCVFETISSSPVSLLNATPILPVGPAAVMNV